jgi:DNA-binding IclR family transcriptional regulator
MALAKRTKALITNADDVLRRSPEALQGPTLVMAILEALAVSSSGKGISELALALQTSKPRVYRYIQTLVSLGYAEQDSETGRYSASIEVYLLGERVRAKIDLLAAVRPEMDSLRDRFGQTVTVSRILGDSVVIVAVSPGHMPLEITSRVGTKYDPHASAHGKAALAYNAALRRRALAGTLRAWTPKTITSRRVLEAELVLVRRRGWASACEEAMLGINVLACPIFDECGDYAGAIALIGSLQYVTPDPEPEQVKALQFAARATSLRLGWRDPERAGG